MLSISIHEINHWLKTYFSFLSHKNRKRNLSRLKRQSPRSIKRYYFSRCNHFINNVKLFRFVGKISTKRTITFHLSSQNLTRYVSLQPSTKIYYIFTCVDLHNTCQIINIASGLGSVFPFPCHSVCSSSRSRQIQAIQY